MFLVVAATDEDLPRFSSDRCISRPVGIGLVESALRTAHLIEHYNPEMVVCTGSCSSVDPELKVSDLIIASSVHHYAFASPDISRPPVMPLFQGFLGIEGNHPFRIHNDVTIGSADVHLESKHYRFWKQEIERLGIQAVDMESYSVASACHSRGVDCVVLRYVSRTQAKRGSERSSSPRSQMVERTGCLIAQVLQRAE